MARPWEEGRGKGGRSTLLLGVVVVVAGETGPRPRDKWIRVADWLGSSYAFPPSPPCRRRGRFFIFCKRNLEALFN